VALPEPTVTAPTATIAAGAGSAAAAADFGYADQARLSRDVRALTGVPSTVLVAD
jgi:hypothetical protein